MHRNLSLPLVVTSATAWAAGWMVLGLWLLFVAPAVLAGGVGSVSLPPSLRVVAGLTAICAGQLVFLSLVADRLFPLASRRIVWPVELAIAAGLFVGIAVLAVQLLGIYLG